MKAKLLILAAWLSLELIADLITVIFMFAAIYFALWIPLP